MRIMTTETSEEPGVAGLDATALRPWNVVAIAFFLVRRLPPRPAPS